MNTIATAIILLSVTGLICAVLITVASKLMFVKVDPRMEKIQNALPGANCGACGFSSCESYAAALLKDEAATNLCPPGGDNVYERLNAILGVGAGDGLSKKIAIVQCIGDAVTMEDKLDYVGINTCFAAAKYYGGHRACTFGCIGFGDCVHVCPSSAICVESKLARIDPRKCSGCEVCLKVCPTGVISVEAEPVSVVVMCKNTEKGASLKDKCKKGCIGCQKCVKVCPTGAMAIKESLAVIDYTKCSGCGDCIEVCIKKCIV